METGDSASTPLRQSSGPDGRNERGDTHHQATGDGMGCSPLSWSCCDGLYPAGEHAITNKDQQFGDHRAGGEPDHLQRQVADGIDELRQDGNEEDQRFGIGELEGEATEPDPPGRLVRCSGWMR
jgi:hypothetical protein